MNNFDDIPKISEYVSIKETAKMLGISEKTVYYYIDQGRIKPVRASNFVLIPASEIENFKRKGAGRPRRLIPKWRISSKDGTFFATSIKVSIFTNKQVELLERFEQIRRSGEHDFPGTIERYIMGQEQAPEWIEIILIWKQGIMPDEEERERSLVALRTTTSDVLDWSTAEYRHNKVYMHT